MTQSLLLAGIIGPVLIALSLSEYLNFKIWKQIDATVVYLNGLVLLIGGLVIARLHNRWPANWTILISIIGWLCILAGLFRMFFPSQKQLAKSIISTVLLIVLFAIGVFLTVKGYGLM